MCGGLYDHADAYVHPQDEEDHAEEEINDFSLPGIQGRELPNFTVGVLGTGRIGRAVIRDLVRVRL